VAGVAHEINNPVNFIYGNLIHADTYIKDLLNLISLYRDMVPNPGDNIEAEIEAIELDFLQDDLPKLLRSMQVGAERIRNIIESLRNFSRVDESEMKPVNIHEGIDSTLLILSNRVKPKPDRPGVEIVKEYGELPSVECYASQLNQVFMNLLANALDTLEEAEKCKSSEEWTPQIRIKTETTDRDRVRVTIADNGMGIPEETGDRIFDHFFTTKPVGKGTGIGLSISHQIIAHKHGGQMHHVSQPNEGTKFIVEIPLRQPSRSKK
jgi:signal transduction histidine kinase